MKKHKLILIILLLQTFLTAFALQVNAQFQEDPFSGGSPDSYVCLDANGRIDTASTPFKDLVTGEITCPDGPAILKPPTLQQVELWFVRILYAVWALIATLSFVMLLALGYQYMISKGDVTKITAIRQRIINYAIGFALVFLAVPILSTVFRLMGINTDYDCYNLELPTFQFFFADLCTDPLSNVDEDPCSFGGSANGMACSTVGVSSSTCQVCDPVNPTGLCIVAVNAGFTGYYYECTSSGWAFRIR